MKKIKITNKLFLQLRDMKPLSEIVLFINNNAFQLIEEIENLTDSFREQLDIVYENYLLFMIKEQGESSLMPNYLNLKLKRGYTNIVIRLHCYVDLEDDYSYVYRNKCYWQHPGYNLYNTKADAARIYRLCQTKELTYDAFHFILLKNYTYYNSLEFMENSVNSQAIVVYLNDSEKYEENIEEDIGYMLGAVIRKARYKKKEVIDVLKYKENYEKIFKEEEELRHELGNTNYNKGLDIMRGNRINESLDKKKKEGLLEQNKIKKELGGKYLYEKEGEYKKGESEDPYAHYYAIEKAKKKKRSSSLNES